MGTGDTVALRKNDPFAGEIVRRVKDGPRTLTVEVKRDRRLRTSARWTLHDQAIQIRVPVSMEGRPLDRLLEDIVFQVLEKRAIARERGDEELQRRADAINQRYFDGEIDWNSIRWVNNMQYRLGSCTSGGVTDGDIRISERLKTWPDYVLDYVIAHEMAHRKYPNHSPAFWDYLARYPGRERAQGFIDGFAFAQGSDAHSLL